MQTISVHAQSPVLELDGPAGADRIGGHIDYYLDFSHELTPDDIVSGNAVDFVPIETEVPDFGYTDAMVWLRLRIANDSADRFDWRLYFHENFKQIFEVYVVRGDGKIENRLSQQLDSPFTSRPVAFPELVAPFEVAPGEPATILVRFWTEGSSNLSFSIETVESFTAITTRKSAKNFAYYGMVAILVAASLVAFVAMRRVVFLAYAAYAGSALLFLMHSDGAAFQYLWPGFPRFNSFASIVTGSALVMSGANFARVFLNTRRFNPVVDKVLIAVIAVTAGMFASAFVIDNQIVKKVLILVALSATIIFAMSGLVAARTRFKQVRFFVLAWVGAVLSALIMTVRHWFGVEISQEFQYDSMRIVMVFDATMMGMAIVDRYNQLRRARQEAMQASLDQTRRNLEITQRLQELEESYATAVRAVAHKDRQIEHTIHDLRQPLHALRLNVHNLVNGVKEPAGTVPDIDEAFTYLERLVLDHLDRSGGNGHAVEPDALADIDGLGLGEILASVHEMFLPDAREKGLEFRYVRSSAHAAINQLAVMRIVTNLVANAIKYTDSGKILLGVRRSGDALRIEVHDTGPGLGEAEFAEACKRARRMGEPDSNGYGYGLAIVGDLCVRHGYTLSCDPARTGGLGVTVSIPLFAAQTVPGTAEAPGVANLAVSRESH